MFTLWFVDRITFPVVSVILLRLMSTADQMAAKKSHLKGAVNVQFVQFHKVPALAI